MSNRLILISDSDPKNLQILKENLEASGFRVITVSDGLKAWEEIQRTTPDMVLTEITLPELTGFQLLEKLQADPNTSSIPLIFLTNQREVQQRVRSFQMGAKDYLVKPLHVKEVIAHIRMVLRRLDKKKSDIPNNRSKFSGSLSELNLADLIENFSVERKTGVLTLTNGRHTSGQVYFRDGAVINASLGDIRLENAVYKMLTWNSGHFSMEFKEVDVPDEISISNLGLLLEGTKKMERIDKLIRKFPSPNTAFVITSTFKKLLQKKKLSPDVKKFVTLLDGKMNIKSIIAESSYDEFKTLERLQRLYDQGFIEPTIKPKKVPGKKAQPPKPVRKEKKQEPQTPETKVPPKEPTKEEADLPKLPEIPRPIEQRIKSHRSEIIIPEEKEIAGNNNNNQESEQESPVEKADVEDVPPKPAEHTDPKAEEKPPVTEKPLAPVFDRDEFMKKEKKQETPFTIEKQEDATKEIPSQEQNEPHELSNFSRNQILAIGLDEDNLDEIMDILTNNMFQSKQFEALPDMQIHFGKIASHEFSFVTLLGIIVDKAFLKLVGALSEKLIGLIFIVDCLRDDLWEYQNYLIHTISDTFKLPVTIALMNYQEQNSVTFDVVRYKLNLKDKTPIVAWDPDNDTSVKELLTSTLFPTTEIPERPEKMLNELIEKVTF
ncbi:response regulator [candidate division KSB1 bacterium]|nr:response regulator [candidate division KSB1 bacterium]